MGNAKEAEAAASAAPPGIPPPPYQETYDNTDAFPPFGQAPAYEAGGSSSAAEPVSGVKRKFPPALNAYMGLAKTFHLGEKKEKPLFAVRMHSGFTKNPDLVLYDGPSDKGPILATATHKSVWKSTSIITVPTREGVAHDSENQRIEMPVHTSFGHRTFTFTANVGVGKETRCEEFEWRSSRGSEVKELDGNKWGWKLVRLSSRTLGGGGERASRVLGSTSDGLEVVAAWAQNNSFSMTKVFKFQLMGSALNGMLGERGAVLALMTALRIWWIEMNSATAAGASSSAAASSAAAAAAS
ncbi:hypothetical protein GGR51DRAFT_541674 [Nemania sp. FL0031]|nr:hypothetical protein GGR51DRAFT_541674 [Nemania sp. FL0031]